MTKCATPDEVKEAIQEAKKFHDAHHQVLIAECERHRELMDEINRLACDLALERAKSAELLEALRRLGRLLHDPYTTYGEVVQAADRMLAKYEEDG